MVISVLAFACWIQQPAARPREAAGARRRPGAGRREAPARPRRRPAPGTRSRSATRVAAYSPLVFQPSEQERASRARGSPRARRSGAPAGRRMPPPASGPARGGPDATPLDRRSFLAAAGAAVAGAAAARAAQSPPRPAAASASARRSRSPAATPTPSHRPTGRRATAPAYCPDIRLDDRERIRATVEAFARHDVVIAEVGRLGEPAGPRPGGAPQERRHGDRGARARRGGGRPLLRGHRGIVQPDELVRPPPRQPLRAVLRRRGRERTEDPRRGCADAHDLLLRDDGLVPPGQPRRLPADAEGGRPQGLRRPPRPVQPRELPRALLPLERPRARVLREARRRTWRASTPRT